MGIITKDLVNDVKSQIEYDISEIQRHEAKIVSLKVNLKLMRDVMMFFK